ncbi:hypothetical protein HYV73_02315 [Candidatus Uhrbacteria bacterium]|nr:hypothetical protein [Candidatus Uhrbacteria bacterium]
MMLARSIAAASLLALLLPSFASAARPDMLGKIFLQVEEHGEAWYIDPVLGMRTYLPDGQSALELLRMRGLGISNADLSLIPIGIEDRFQDADRDGDGLSDQLEDSLRTNKNVADSDLDGFSDGEEVRTGNNPNGAGKMKTDAALAKRLSGRILLQVETNGEAWYVNPADLKRYYMKDGNAAYQIMRFLGVGITNKDLEYFDIAIIEAGPETGLATKRCGTDMDCFIAAVGNTQSATVNFTYDFHLWTISTHVVQQLETRNVAGNIQYQDTYLSRQMFITPENRLAMKNNGKTDAQIDADLVQMQLSTDSVNVLHACTVQNTSALVDVLKNWKMGTFRYESGPEGLGGDYAAFGPCTETQIQNQ